MNYPSPFALLRRRECPKLQLGGVAPNIPPAERAETEQESARFRVQVLTVQKPANGLLSGSNVGFLLQRKIILLSFPVSRVKC